MVNPQDSPLRPSILGSVASSLNTSRNSVNETINIADLTAQISQIVTDILTRDGPRIISNIVNPDTDRNDETDQTIDINVDRNLADLDKIPDIVKSLRDFSGQPGEFSSWKKSVDRILRIYQHLKGTPKYYGILSVVRNKIVGHADVVLESYNTPLNWPKMSKCLTLHYADKRDLGTLEYQMTTLVQGSHTVPEFYQMVYQHLSLILNKLSCMDMGVESLDNMTRSYRDKALDTFVRGLKGDLPRLLSIKEPVDLPQALHLCLKLQNVDYRTQYANNSHHHLQRKPVAPPLPPRRFNAPNSNFHNSFYPQLLHNPRGQQNPMFSRPIQPFTRPTFQQNPLFQNKFSQPYRPQLGYSHKPFPKPEPMDVDHSLQSRQANYMNRPYQKNQPQQKRPYLNPSQQTHPPNKFQRIYHTEPNASVPNTPEEEVEADDSNIEEDTNTQSFEDYMESVENPTFDQTEELDDIYFLD